ncbi:HIT family protein [Patescibacteria group bacterium]
MKKSSNSTNCIFCRIVSGDIPSEIIWDDDSHVAFLTPFPNTEGFTVVATKEHKPSYAFENDNETLTSIVLATKKVARFIDKAYADVGRCGMFFEGFGVDHLHSKLFPMHGTGNMDDWEMIESDILEVYFDKYPGYLSSHNGKKAEDKELRKIADKIRKAIK